MEALEKLVKKSVLLGLGLASLGKQKVERIVDEFAAKHDLTAEEGEKLVDRLMEASGKARTEVHEQIQKSVRAVLDKTDIPSGAKIKKLEARIAALEKKQKKQ